MLQLRPGIITEIPSAADSLKASVLIGHIQNPARNKALTLPEILRICGAKEVMLCFFCYCAIEQTAGLWASSYLTLYKNVPAGTAARFAGMFFIGAGLLLV